MAHSSPASRPLILGTVEFKKWWQRGMKKTITISDICVIFIIFKILLSLPACSHCHLASLANCKSATYQSWVAGFLQTALPRPPLPRSGGAPPVEPVFPTACVFFLQLVCFSLESHAAPTEPVFPKACEFFWQHVCFSLVHTMGPWSWNLFFPQLVCSS